SCPADTSCSRWPLSRRDRLAPSTARAARPSAAPRAADWRPAGADSPEDLPAESAAAPPGPWAAAAGRAWSSAARSPLAAVTPESTVAESRPSSSLDRVVHRLSFTAPIHRHREVAGVAQLGVERQRRVGRGHVVAVDRLDGVAVLQTNLAEDRVRSNRVQ